MLSVPDKRHRRSIRLPAYDYTSAGAYFVTLVAKDRECLFGSVVNSEVVRSNLGTVVLDEWLRTPAVRPEVELDTFVVMPNHIHSVILIRDDVGAHCRAPLRSVVNQNIPYRLPRSLGSFVAGFKSIVTRRINEMRNSPGVPVWQRNYYERIIRDEEELNRTRQYILDNPANWAEDAKNPAAPPKPTPSHPS